MSKEINIKQQRISANKVNICVPVVSSTRDSILSDVKNIVEKQAPIIELRMDYFENLMDEDALASLLKEVDLLCKNTVVLFTIRTKDEGGEVTISEEEYKNILLKASLSGHVDMIDCELDKVKNPSEFMAKLKENGVYVVASHHNFKMTYDNKDILEIYGRMYEADADIIKLAVMPNKKSDALRLLACTNEFFEEHPDSLMVAIAMGELGKITRACGGYVGSCITFASITKASAPGQIDFDGMKSLLSLLSY